MSEEQMLNWAMQVVVAEEMARAKVTVKPEVRVAQTRYRTVVGRKIGVTIPAVIVDEKGSGQLKELLIESVSKDWRLSVYVDGQQLYSDAYDWFASVSQELDEIAAFQTDDGTYVLHLSDISFSESITVTVDSTAGKPVLKEVFWKLDIQPVSGVG